MTMKRGDAASSWAGGNGRLVIMMLRIVVLVHVWLISILLESTT